MPASVNLTNAPQVKVNGTALPAATTAEINDLRVAQSLSLPSQLTMRINDPEFAVADSITFVIGNEITVAFDDGSGTSVTVFAGDIVGVGTDQSADRLDGNEFVLTALDKSHRLRHATKIRTFQQQKYSDIVRKMAQEHGLRADAADSKVTHAYILQTTSDFDFLNELAFRCGYEWSVTDATLTFKPRAVTAPIEVEYGEDVRRLKTRFSATNEFKSVSVSAWDPLSKKRIVGKSMPNADRMNGNADIAASGRSKAKIFTGDLTTSSLLGTTNDEVTQLANSLATRFDGNGLSARCECVGMPAIRAGRVVKIKNAGTKVSGDYFVASCEHHFSLARNLTTTFTTGGLDRGSIVDLLGGSGGPGGAEPIATFGHAGLTIGIVTNNKDPDGMGRVRVKFPALSDQEESWWARVAAPGGGTSAGLMMMPQIDDEVVVGFEHGDLRRPFVLGGLWGGKAKPPTTSDTFLANNKVVEWGLTTHNGSKFIARGGTTPADKHFKMELADGTLLYLGSDKVEVVTKNKSIELKNGTASVLLSDKGDVQIKGMNVTIEATTALKINGLTVDAKAKTAATLEGGATVTVKGGAAANVEASGIASVKGSLVKIN